MVQTATLEGARRMSAMMPIETEKPQEWSVKWKRDHQDRYGNGETNPRICTKIKETLSLLKDIGPGAFADFRKLWSACGLGFMRLSQWKKVANQQGSSAHHIRVENMTLNDVNLLICNAMNSRKATPHGWPNIWSQG